MDLITADVSPAVPANEAKWAHEARADPRLLADIAYAVGGPFHVLFPDQFGENVLALRETLSAAGVDGTVYFGKKANKSSCWIPECVRSGAGVDVASEPELVRALAGGVRGEDVVVTGAAKKDSLLWLAIRHGALIAVDALDELDRLTGLARRTGPARIQLRVRPPNDPTSRFGLDESELEQALHRCVTAAGALRMEGFSFHLSGYLAQPRAALAAELVDRCVRARTLGLDASSVDIGGGFAVSYVDEQDWRTYTGDLPAEWFHAGRKFGHFYPYHQNPAGADMLAAILDTTVDGGLTLADKLTSTGTRLLMEPGRALLDRAGFSVFRVQGLKHRGDYAIATVGGLSLSVSEQWKNSEFLPDPLLWPRTGEYAPIGVCVGGASCLEYDMLSWRKIPLPRPPRSGDLLVYPSTAGYQMDKNESEFHQLPLPDRVVLDRTAGGFRWRLDR
ncbi:Y4yA family PLP-dependent enzyme [Amycolatopsis jiangsuensis]|uniref:Diaminopimelate decarboxylase n=1 Tax=Amycolatopsis jiangsuensis TaxID=1181879 RepID=A0A840J5I3_9PSEU|nr:Y4yA family PLP-dependent enzyme [Amycolatopsis jiangsuensis]MBB4688692.1 diaminopimelate decarboxylase [Amycolatopsis jiangsuensis]